MRKVLITTEAKKVGKFKTIVHLQPSIFCRNNFSRGILPSWNQGLRQIKIFWATCARNIPAKSQFSFASPPHKLVSRPFPLERGYLSLTLPCTKHEELPNESAVCSCRKFMFQISMQPFVVFLIGVLVEQVSTTVYYVDVKRGAEGNDGKSLGEPFLTLQTCVNALSEPGDECRVRYAMWTEILERQNFYIIFYILLILNLLFNTPHFKTSA